MSEKAVMVVIGGVLLVAVNVAAMMYTGFFCLFVLGASYPLAEKLIGMIEKL